VKPKKRDENDRKNAILHAAEKQKPGEHRGKRKFVNVLTGC
jgi:hypothetical protein